MHTCTYACTYVHISAAYKTDYVYITYVVCFVCSWWRLTRQKHTTISVWFCYKFAQHQFAYTVWLAIPYVLPVTMNTGEAWTQCTLLCYLIIITPQNKLRALICKVRHLHLCYTLLSCPCTSCRKYIGTYVKVQSHTSTNRNMVQGTTYVYTSWAGEQYLPWSTPKFWILGRL